MPFPPGPPGKYGPPHLNRPPFIGGPPHNIKPNLGIPPRRGFGPPPPKPFYGGKPFLTGPSNEFLSGPPSYDIPIEPDDRPYNFEHSSSFHKESFNKDKKVEVHVTAQGGKIDNGVSGVQQHVHHHFHHGDGSNIKVPVPVPVVVNNPTPSFVGSSAFKPSLTIGGSSLAGNYGGQSTANYASSSTFTGLGNFATKPIVENHGPQTFGSSSLYNSNDFGSSPNLYGNSLGASIGSYGSSGFYKKELNLNGVQSNYLQSNGGDKYQALESARAENYDCICVPYDQCPSHEIIGRKDDFYLPLDPRNLKSDIEAATEEERVITDGNGTMTVVRVAKQAVVNSSEISDGDVKRISKREAPVEKEKSKVEPVSISMYLDLTN